MLYQTSQYLHFFTFSILRLYFDLDLYFKLILILNAHKGTFQLLCTPMSRYTLLIKIIVYYHSLLVYAL